MNDLISTAAILSPSFNQALNNTLTDVLELVLIGVATLLGLALKAWISNMKNGIVRAVASTLVAYAEQKIVSNDDRQAYVAGQLSAKFPRLSREEIKHIIEEAVIQLKIQTGGKQ